MTAAKDIALYGPLLERRSAKRAILSPDNLSDGRGGRVLAIADALLAGEEPPKLYISRAEQELELDGINNALSRLIERVGEGIAKKHGRTFDSLNLHLDPAQAGGIPESGEALVAYLENAVTLAARKDADIARAKALKDRYNAALDEYNVLNYELQREGLEPVLASQKAKEKMADPDGLWCIEGQPGHPSMSGRAIGRAEIDKGELVTDGG